MKKILIGAILAVCLWMGNSALPDQAAASPSAPIKNNEPIVLVHGLAGWGKGELAGYLYWGGLKDIEHDLNQKGFKTYTSAVGPFSSNWDRAVELYYFVKGGTVDYGAAHANKYGHARFGRTFPGLYSQWNETHKVHFIGHSMGGQTSRMLAELLEHGSAEERQYCMSPLYQGGKHWVKSVASIGTPHNGSTFADEDHLIPYIKSFVLKAASLSGSTPESIAYDFKLDQWGLKRKKEESFIQYSNRVYSSPIWNSKDMSTYDLSTYGSAEINQWVKTLPDIYYVSYTGNATFKAPLTGFEHPLPTMSTLVIGSGSYIGSYSRKNPKPEIDSSWWANDGLVSVTSSQFPAGQPHQPFCQRLKKGVWNEIPVNYGWDHMDFIGIDPSDRIRNYRLYPFYEKIARQLSGVKE
ncbi:esterase/lipase family protein [Fictibacillus sp. NRS-1165]|uniref:esterase/lipase family protein n=1 Tax=Fictibacillus sp. NRS-1165 TaxID=3144463 RepID=UPI003D1A9146